MRTKLGCDEEEAKYIIEQMIPDEHYEALYENECNDQPFWDKGVFLASIAQETVSDDEEVFDSVFNELLRECVAKQLQRLKPREMEVIKERFGIEGSPKTLEEVGKMMNVTRERIRQIEVKAIKRLRHPSYSKRLKDFY